MTKSIKILDCTLRDGGYLNNWNFGENTIKSVVSKLSSAKIDYIECGFLKSCTFNKDRTFFSQITDLNNIINPNQNYTLMINFGEFEIENFKENISEKIKIRVAFKKHNQKEALDYVSKLKNLGWDVFVNPMSTNTYSKDELNYLIEKINYIKPFGLSIVDTLGNMYEKDVIKIFEQIDSRLDSQIALGFHSHNSLQLSFSNTKTLLKMNLNRNLVIDSCLYGMGRGAGNLCTELITKYLNDNFNNNYSIIPLIQTIDDNIKPIYSNSPWGYSTPYYIAAIRGCHPNYAQALMKYNLSNEALDNILCSIPNEKKVVFDKSILNTLKLN